MKWVHIKLDVKYKHAVQEKRTSVCESRTLITLFSMNLVYCLMYRPSSAIRQYVLNLFAFYTEISWSPLRELKLSNAHLHVSWRKRQNCLGKPFLNLITYKHSNVHSFNNDWIRTGRVGGIVHWNDLTGGPLYPCGPGIPISPWKIRTYFRYTMYQ